MIISMWKREPCLALWEPCLALWSSRCGNGSPVWYCDHLDVEAGPVWHCDHLDVEAGPIWHCDHLDVEAGALSGIVFISMWKR